MNSQTHLKIGKQEEIMNNYNDSWNYTGATNTINFTDSTLSYITLTGGTCNSITPDKNWMPYVYVEYEPTWHKKFARFKIQMESMWE